MKQANVNIIAMNTLASGFINPKEAYKYLSTFPQIKSWIFVSSSKKNIYESFFEINKNIFSVSR